MKYFFILFFATIIGSTQSQVTVYDQNEKEEPTNLKSNSKSKYYKLKVDLEDALAVGTGMIYAEKNFTDNLGLEVGIGITYISLVNVYTYSLQSSNSSNGSSPYSVFFGDPISSNVAGADLSRVYFPTNEFYRFKPGFAISAFPKVYLEDDPTEGYFIGIQAQFKNYNMETTTGVNKPYISQSLNKFNLSFNVGNTLNLSDNFITETYMGLGVAFVSDVRNGSYNDAGTYKDIKVTFTPTRFHYQVGARLCYVF